MTTKLAFAALLVLGAVSTPALAASDKAFSPDGAECKFVGEVGGYVCEIGIEAGASSLTLPQDGNSGKPKLTVVSLVGTPTFTVGGAKQP